MSERRKIVSEKLEKRREEGGARDRDTRKLEKISAEREVRRRRRDEGVN